MNTKVFGLFTFVAGAVVGSLATFVFMKKKYEELIDENEEFEEFNESDDIFEEPENEEEPQPTFKTQMKPNISDYAKMIEKENYDKGSINYSDIFREEKKGGEENMPKGPRPYVIPPEEFAELDDYEAISLNYYADGVLTDDWDNVIEDVDSLVGIDSLSHFGEFEDDSVFVRNDEIKKDFEILLDTRTFESVVNDSPNGTR